MKIIPETFQPATAAPSEVGDHCAKYINGTVQVEFKGETITTYAVKREDGDISALGFVGKYRTGTKAWNVSVLHKNGNTFCRFGFDSRSRKHRKSDIYFCPERFYDVKVAA